MVEVLDAPTLIRVSDSGPGIAIEERGAVLERFVRGRVTTGEGSGLGLAIVREIALLHGASLSLDQSPWGRGLSVTIRFV